LLSAALHDSVEAHIVFQRVRAHEVVVTRRGEAHRDAAGLIDPSGEWLEA